MSKCREEHFDAVVLGAGITGLVSASVLLQDGCRRVLVIDEYDHIGGNHIACNIGAYTFDVGSFIFQDDSPLLTHLPELMQEYVPIDPSWGRLNPQGIVTTYPFSIKEDLISAGPVEWSRILLSVATARIFRRRLRNAEDFATFWIGARLLHRSGLKSYMARFYGRPADEIDIRFAEKRMLWIKEHAMLRNLVRRWPKASRPRRRNQQLARPREGFSCLYEGAAERLMRSGVTFELGAKLRSVGKRGDAFVVETEGLCGIAGRLVSTIPIPRIQDLCAIPADDRLQTVTLISLFFSFSGMRGFRQSVLYNFSHQGAWKRLTVYSDFYGVSDGREFFAVEVNADHVLGSVSAAERDFREHVAKNSLFLGDLRMEGTHTLANAYPIYTDGADEIAARAIAELRAMGIESIGRQGRFDYQPTARDSTLKAEVALGRSRAASMTSGRSVQRQERS